MRRLEAYAFGDVQGVAFRAFTAREARSRGLVGTAENLPDGSVHIIAEGKAHELESFLLQIKAGSRFARVDKVNEEWGVATGTFSDFRVI